MLPRRTYHLFSTDAGEEIVEEEMEGVEEEEVTHEQEFDFKQFLRTFSSPKVIRVYALLLTLYKTNEVAINHCIVKMLHRIAVQVQLMCYDRMYRCSRSIIVDSSYLPSLPV